MSQIQPIPATGITVKAGDTVQLVAQSSSATAFTVRLNLNIVSTDGTVGTSYNTLESSTNRSIAAAKPDVLPAGTITSAAVQTLLKAGQGLPAQPGILWAAANISRAGAIIGTICGGYIWNGQARLAFPGTPKDNVDGPGRIYTFSGAVPAAGAEISDLVPTNARWILRAIEVDFVTSGAAASRLVNLAIDDQGAEITRKFIATDTTAQITALTRTHGWYPGTDAVNTASVSITDVGDASEVILAKFPEILSDGIPLIAGDKIRTFTTLIDVADQYSAARYVVEEWLIGP